MRTLVVLVLLCLALAGVSARVWRPDAEACAAGDVLGVQPATGDDLDDLPWDVPTVAPAVESGVSPLPEVTPARDLRRLDDRRRTRPPRA